MQTGQASSLFTWNKSFSPHASVLGIRCFLLWLGVVSILKLVVDECSDRVTDATGSQELVPRPRLSVLSAVSHSLLSVS